MKLLRIPVILVAVCSLAFGNEIYPKPGTALDLSSKNALPSGQIVSDGNSIKIGKVSVRLVGTNGTDSANFPIDPALAASNIRKMGYNGYRAHHIDRLLMDDLLFPTYFPLFYNYVKELTNRGIRVSIDGYSKGREHIEGNETFKALLYGDDVKATALYHGYLQRLLTTKGPDEGTLLDKIWLICLVNEGAHITTPDRASTFAIQTKAFLATLGYKGLVGDLPDGSIDQNFAKQVSALDVCLVHQYGDDARDNWRNGYWLTSWLNQGWQWDSLRQFQKQSGKHGIVQEYASFPYNPNRGANLFFLAGEIQRWGYSAYSFAWATNRETLAGTEPKVDQYAINTDLVRTISDALVRCLFAYDKRTSISTLWPHDAGYQSKMYSYYSSSASIDISNDYGVAIISTTGELKTGSRLLLFTVCSTDYLGMQSTQVTDLVKTITNPGTTDTPFLLPGVRVNLLTERHVSSAYQLNPWTGERIAQLKQYGDSYVVPLYKSGIVEINTVK